MKNSSLGDAGFGFTFVQCVQGFKVRDSDRMCTLVMYFAQLGSSVRMLFI